MCVCKNNIGGFNIRKRQDGLYQTTGVYGIRDTLNNRIYVGQTLMNFGDRRDSHFSLLRNGKHACAEMQSDFTEHGEGAFEFVVLVQCGADTIDQHEARLIDHYQATGLAYNKCGGGRIGYVGAPVPEHAKRIIGEKNRVNGLGRRASEETKCKMSEARKGKKRGPMSEDQKHRMSVARSGENGPLAKLTEEQVIEMRRLRREEGLPWSELSRRFGVTGQCVADICNYKRWKYTA